jgi:prepilin-type N-terminal cleavage/methylation domain-containing protein
MPHNAPGGGASTMPVPVRDQPTPDSPAARRRGFTLVEILVAVTVIAILVGMAFLGFKFVGNSTRSKQTAVTMEQLKSMLS